MKNFLKPLPADLSATIDTFASDVNKLVDVLAEIRTAVPSTPADIGAISSADYAVILNRVTALEAAVKALETASTVTAPSAPTITGVIAGDTSVSVSFSAPASTGGSTVTKYIATTSTGKSVEGTSSPIIISGLTNGTSMTVTLRAVNSVGTSAASASSQSVTPVSISKPSAPTNLAAIAGNGSVNLTWNAPASDGGATISGYRITRNGTTTSDVSATQRSFSATGLTNGTSYTFTVAAINSNGVGPTTSITVTPVTLSNESAKVALLGISTGQFSKLPFNSGVNAAERSGRYGSPDGYQFLSDAIAGQRGVPFDVMTGYQYNNRSISEGSTAWNDLKGMQTLDWFDPKYPAVLGINMFPNGGTFASASSGAYDAQYVAIGATIKSKRPAGTGKVVLRPYWEFNLSSTVKNDVSGFKAAWIRMISKIREGAGDRVKFSWSLAANTSSLVTLQSMYPGNDYVDVIGIDTYDAFINTGQGYHTEAAWLQWTGISEVFAWAKSNNKLIGFDEWGGHNNNVVANHSGGDNPDWPNIVLEWSRKNADWVAYELSFNDIAAGNVANNLWGYNGVPVQLPNQRAAYIAKIKSLTTGAVTNPPVQSNLIWQGDTSKSTLAEAMAFSNVNSSYASLGSLVTSSSVPDGSTRVFRSQMSTANAGYRAHNEISRVAAGFPRDTVVLEYYFRITTMGSLQTHGDAKVGFGLVGAPANASESQISYGGTKLANSWSARTTIVGQNYLRSSGSPWGLAAYLYAEYGGGQTYSSFGLRKEYLNSAGQIFQPVQGVWYKHRIELKVNTSGSNNGIYRAWIDGVQYVNLTDMRWNPAGQDVKIGYVMTQTFPNTPNMSSPAVFDQSAPALYVP